MVLVQEYYEFCCLFFCMLFLWGTHDGARDNTAMSPISHERLMNTCCFFFFFMIFFMETSLFVSFSGLTIWYGAVVERWKKKTMHIEKLDWLDMWSSTSFFFFLWVRLRTISEVILLRRVQCACARKSNYIASHKHSTENYFDNDKSQQ